MMCFCAISLSRAVRIVLIHHVDAVADALGMARFNGLADVKAQALGRNEARQPVRPRAG